MVIAINKVMMVNIMTRSMMRMNIVAPWQGLTMKMKMMLILTPGIRECWVAAAIRRGRRRPIMTTITLLLLKSQPLFVFVCHRLP